MAAVRDNVSRFFNVKHAYKHNFVKKKVVFAKPEKRRQQAC